MKESIVTVFGYGNPGRQDDGLGPALIELLENEKIPGLRTQTGFQLNIEDAYTIADGDSVIFVDASVNCSEPFEFYEIKPSSEIRFTTHSISPESVLALCNDLFNSSRRAFMLSIRGYNWEFAEGLSGKAGRNLTEAYEFLISKLRSL